MHTWKWKTWDIGWTHKGELKTQNTVLLIHGFGANTNHWRFNHSVLAKQASTYAIDLLGFGRSDQPRSRLKDEPLTEDAVHYGRTGQQVPTCTVAIRQPVVLVGNSLVVSPPCEQLKQLGNDAKEWC